MKKVFAKLSFLLLGTIILTSSCKKVTNGPTDVPLDKMHPEYINVSAFGVGIQLVKSQSQARNIMAYLDTLPNGFPCITGRKVPLENIANAILQKLENNQVESAVYDVFHFDGATFSLISYIRKAQMVGDISPQQMINLIAAIQLPPIPVVNFDPPKLPNAVAAGNCCTENVCNPQIKILVTWAHKAPCGNYDKGSSGYAANNKLSGMPSGQSYRFDAEVYGCPCPGNWTVKVTPPAGATSYGISENGKRADVLPVSLGVYTITFTYTVCGQTITKTFTLSV